MGKVMHQKTTVLPGGKIEIIDIDLPVGESVEVVVSLPSVPAGEPIEVEVRNLSESTRRSAVDILDEAPGHLLFKSAEEVDSYLREERASWND